MSSPTVSAPLGHLYRLGHHSGRPRAGSAHECHTVLAARSTCSLGPVSDVLQVTTIPRKGLERDEVEHTGHLLRLPLDIEQGPIA